MRSALGYMTEIAGLACVVTGAWMIYPPAAVIIAGLGLILGAQAAR